ncbi:MAG: AMP-binding protein, partial [Methyloprofundus sp.]|nr:AMP-binding protein [Methyloprofundus sp.]
MSVTPSKAHFLSLQNTLNNTLHLDFCILDDKNISRATLLTDAVTLSEQLPNKHYAINLCQDRYLFIVSYLAVCIRQQVSLLPQNQARNTLQKLSETYPDSYTLSDDKLADFYLHKDLLSPSSTQDFPDIDIDRPLSISFTSGSTGTPKAISKTWREFQTSAGLALQQFKLHDKAITLVSTAPMQHMFGLETCLFWVLFSKLVLHNSR